MRLFFLLLTSILFLQTAHSQERQRARDLGIKPGILTPGPLNAITDVEGVKVGHRTIIEGENIRTGVTMIFPHDGDLFKSRVPAAVYVGNGFGKALGFTQVQELGELETPIGLTNTLSIHTVANGITDYMLQQPGNENVRSVNPVVGETNDGWLNDIRGRHVTMEHVFDAIENAKIGPVEEGSVGAGTGTSALGFKGGIGTSSRTLPEKHGGYTVGVLVQSNFGGVLTINGAPVGEELENHYMASDVPYDVDGSVMIIVATDAPLLSRNLERLAKRAFLGISRVGGFASNGSGDYVIAFSTSEDVRISTRSSGSTQDYTELNNSATTPLFLAAVEATEEAILNSLFMATTITGDRGNTQQALPIDQVLDIMRKYNLLKE
ncbi:MAG TPA: P1 family peptidase [Gracilimonas sp.]|uniref:DmpA family aminopeptidase n=1 Tax=Gracilimonas sp. TaxID=1974203 RepID=UPI002D8C2297|nr:P1 family peptidase [Gracilimonas sp.]